MRKKELKLILTFHSTAEALAVEKLCHQKCVPGRLIPVPQQISAGCGLAWCTAVNEREHLTNLLKLDRKDAEAFYELMI